MLFLLKISLKMNIYKICFYLRIIFKNIKVSEKVKRNNIVLEYKYKW